MNEVHIDLGNGYLKGMWGAAAKQEWSAPSAYAEVADRFDATELSASDVEAFYRSCVILNGSRYVMGDLATTPHFRGALNRMTGIARYTHAGGGYYQNLVWGNLALNMDKLDGTDLNLYLSQPAAIKDAPYATDGTTYGTHLKLLFEGKSARVGHYENIKGSWRLIEKTLKIRKCSVSAESFGLWALLAIAADGRGLLSNNQMMLGGLVGLLDIGHGTTDITFFDRGSYVKNSSSSTNYGIGNLLNAFANAVVGSGIPLLMTPAETAAAFGSGQVIFRGTTHNLNHIINEVVSRWFVPQIRSLWYERADLADQASMIILGGGGSVLVAPWLDLPHDSVRLAAKNAPHMGHVRGMYRSMLAKQALAAKH
jgi:hypothetical protein